MAIRAKFAALCPAGLGALLLLVGASNVAAAHPGHHHAPTAVTAPRAPAPSVAPDAAVEAPDAAEDVNEQLVGRRAATLEGLVQSRSGIHLSTPAKAPLPLDTGNCCCGSIACHAAIELPAAVAIGPIILASKVEPLLATGAAKSDPHGIDRPPRGLPL
jgi:hypothetical protein